MSHSSLGMVYLVGAGPGDPGLLTLKGREILSRADVVIYDRLVSLRLLDMAPSYSLRIYVGKRPDHHTLEQEEINRLLVDQAREGRRVVRLKGGDPFVFGRGGEEAMALTEAGIPFEIIPGITSGIAAGSYAGIPVTHRGLASSVAFITGHEDPLKGGSDLDFRILAQWKGTLVFYMGVENLRSICQELVRHGLDPATPAAAVQMATTPEQRTVLDCVAGLPDAVASAGLKPPTIIYVGMVALLREHLKWFENRPLFGLRIVNTRPMPRAHELSDPLRSLGADVWEVPTIQIEPLKDVTLLKEAIERLESYDWVIFTSGEGVQGFFDLLNRMGKDARALARNKICVIGPGTASRLKGFGLIPDLMPERFTSKSIVRALPEKENLAGKRILCPRADIAPEELIRSLSHLGAEVSSVPTYHVIPAAFDEQGVIRELSKGRIHWITFTSPSTAKNFFSQVPAERVRESRAKIASIGPVTTQALEGLGLSPSVEAPLHTMPGLVSAILGQVSGSSPTSL